MAHGGGLAFGRIHREEQARGDQGQHRALFFRLGGGDEVGEPLSEAQPFLPDEIERGDRTLVGIAQLQPLPVLGHPVLANLHGASFA